MRTAPRALAAASRAAPARPLAPPTRRTSAALAATPARANTYPVPETEKERSNVDYPQVRIWGPEAANAARRRAAAPARGG